MPINPTHCCDQLQAQVELRCDRHPEPGSCSDYLIGYIQTFNEYGIWIHDGPDGSAHSWRGIQFCPFCGTELPVSRRDQWFDRLEELGLESEQAPAEMLSFGWWHDTAK